ncbi:hypothetical protein OG500_01895 [Kitasatospora sp. NBC_01250]|uniref:beta/gamma crystallin domain-containing protein n=1 Tax=unclassified Kitasatospora TaxID=2633591 RepID=UPI002E0F7235|nr:MULTISPECIES: beta/gamma crystallin domain-containing protein [unclassified Kitasatospora]WSJ64939.1 hypothetical protein OG294_01825 [Kitasatospora sp. NBC_01302]
MAHLKNKTVAALVAVLATAGLAITPTGIASAETAKPAIDAVLCNSNDYLQVWFHQENQSPRAEEICFANAGTYSFPDNQQCTGGPCWLDAFSTGNNVVQYESDNRWQPDNPVGKYTYFTFPNHPGGVELDAMKIF